MKNDTILPQNNSRAITANTISIITIYTSVVIALYILSCGVTSSYLSLSFNLFIAVTTATVIITIPVIINTTPVINFSFGIASNSIMFKTPYARFFISLYESCISW